MINITEKAPQNKSINLEISGLYKEIIYNDFIRISNGLNVFDSDIVSDIVNYLRSYDTIDIRLNCGLNKILPKSTQLLSEDKWILKPFKHQLDGIKFGKIHDSFLLLDDPGMGKTLQMIYLAEELKEQEGLEHCLIVCGINALKSNWKKEIQKCSRLSCRILGEKVSKKGRVSYSTTAERAKEILNPISEFFIITNIETLRNDNVIESIKKSKNKIGMIVLDEAHKVKSANSQQAKNLKKLSKYKHKIALTGTLIMNKPLDAFNALKWIDVEKSNLTDFKSQYCVFGGFGNHQIVGYKNIDSLKSEIEMYSLRRKKTDIEDFPDKIIINEVIEMEDDHRKFYENVQEGIKSECDKIDLNPKKVLALTTRLKQATVCPSILTSENINASKINRAFDLIEEICATGEKVVVMSTYKQPLQELYNKLNEYGYKVLLGTGDLDDAEVSSNIDKFQNLDDYRIFLATTSKCGTGITLNAASYMICIDLPWTYALQQQVEDRINRITNKKSATIYRLICQGTIDEAILSTISTKKAISDYIIDDTVDDETIYRLRAYIEDL